MSNPHPDIMIQCGRKAEEREGMVREWLRYSECAVSTRRYLWLTVWHKPEAEFSAVMEAVSGAYKRFRCHIKEAGLERVEPEDPMEATQVLISDFSRQYPINTDEAFIGKKAPE